MGVSVGVIVGAMVVGTGSILYTKGFGYPTRNEFSTTHPDQYSFAPGYLFATNSIVGNLRFIPAGSFVQGSNDSCAGSLETPFVHHAEMPLVKKRLRNGL